MSPPAESLANHRQRTRSFPLFLSAYSWDRKTWLLERTGTVSCHYIPVAWHCTPHIDLHWIRIKKYNFQDHTNKLLVPNCLVFSAPTILYSCLMLHRGISGTGMGSQLVQLFRHHLCYPLVTQLASWTSLGPPNIHEQTSVAGHTGGYTVWSQLQFSSPERSVVQHI